ncbi:hypothetical protein GOODEAATRI_004878, partial [Goodea atripinnis]
QCCFIDCQLYEYLYIKEEKTWTEAQQYCREKHTDLATVSNMRDMKRLLNISEGNMGEAWIGLYDQTAGKRKWYWSLPGVEFNESETNWASGEALDTGSENCGFIGKNLTWGDYYCDLKQYFLCYDGTLFYQGNEDLAGSPELLQAESHRPGQWTKPDKVILIKEKKNWMDALSSCRNNYRDLVTITNADEQRWVQEKAKKASTPFVWIGLRFNSTLNVWLWVCPEMVSYRNNASDGGTDDCHMSGAMETGGKHKWFQKNGTEEFNFICFC